MAKSKSESGGIGKLVEQARKDAKFFHSLVFNTESVLSKLGYLDRATKAKLLALRPEDFIQSLIGQVSWCDGTCGASSCIDTCGMRSCGRTCDDSCGNTCSHSCGDTTQIVGIRDLREIGQRISIR